MLAFLTDEAVREAFKIPNYQGMQTRTKEDAQAMFEKGPDACMTLINNEWVLETRRHHSNLPKKLLSSDFKEDFSDMIFLLNRILGHLKELYLSHECFISLRRY